MMTERPDSGWKFGLGWVLASATGFAASLIMRHVTRFVVEVGLSAIPIESYAVYLVLMIGIGVLIGVVAGAVTGAGQRYILRRRASQVTWWILASIVGFVVGLSIAGVMNSGLAEYFLDSVVKHSLGAYTSSDSLGIRDAAGNTLIALNKDEIYVRDAAAMGLIVADAVVAYVVPGLAVGIAQWVTLRRQIARAGWWMLANAAGWAGGAIVAGIAYPVVFYPLFIALAGHPPERSGMGDLFNLIIAIAIGRVVEIGASGSVYGTITAIAMVGLLRRPATRSQRPAGRRWLLIDLVGAGLGLVLLVVTVLVVLRWVALRIG